MSNRPRLLLTREQLRDRLLGLTGATGVSFVAVTEPDWIKYKRNAKDDKGNKIPNTYIGNVVKVARVFGQVNFSYENAVLNANMREIEKQREDAHEPPLSPTDLRHEAIRRYEKGESWSQPLKVGDRLTPFCINKKDAAKIAAGEAEGVPLYLWFRSLDCIRVMFVNVATGDEVSRAELADFMTAKNEDAGENQGIEDPNKRVVPRAYGFSGVAEMNTRGECWVNESWYNANPNIRRAIEVVARTLKIPD